MQESRLFRILYYLLDKSQATAPELAEKFEVSVRTIYRDIDALSGAGIPIYAETGRNGGIHLMSNFVMDKAVLSEEEKQEMLAALQGLNAVHNIRHNHILSKLSAIFNTTSENWLEVDFSRWENDEKDNEKFTALKSSVVHHKAVNITYAGACEEISERKIHPLKLVYKSKAWYVQAYCTVKKDFRLFKLTRILEWESLDEEFSYHDFPEKRDIFQREYNTITLRFPKEMAYRVYDEFDKTQVQRHENGDLIVSAKMPEDPWLIGFLLSFGTQVDIIEPAYLKKILAEKAKLIYEKNKP
ncbi:MAG: YafY family transcriptional regulator [Clostridia bacterium]|nr:YafY family transcriptional regulator [Clostridia bacterium]NCD03059.1 YafY family transcriptional regulator [Clostridia bacterium]